MLHTMSSIEKNFTSEQRIELALIHLNRARKESDRIPTFDELARDYDVPKSTLWHRDHGRIPTSEYDERKQYLTSGEEQALVNWYKLNILN